MRGQRYPWKVGATSFVIAGSVEENVLFLAGKVDDIQLLFFESSWQARLPHTIDMALLADLAAQHLHSYTVHLPLDLQLGTDDLGIRDRCIDEICHIVERCTDLDPKAYDLHLNLETNLEHGNWCDLCATSLGLLRDRLGSAWNRICIENINYKFALIADVIDHCAAKTCVDFGHLHHQGHTDERYFSHFNIGHVHLHGVMAGRDHQPLTAADIPFLQRLAQDMVVHDYAGVVTLELYKEKWLAESLDILQRAWSDFGVKQ